MRALGFPRQYFATRRCCSAVVNIAFELVELSLEGARAHGRIRARGRRASVVRRRAGNDIAASGVLATSARERLAVAHRHAARRALGRALARLNGLRWRPWRMRRRAHQLGLSIRTFAAGSVHGVAVEADAAGVAFSQALASIERFLWGLGRRVHWLGGRRRSGRHPRAVARRRPAVGRRGYTAGPNRERQRRVAQAKSQLISDHRLGSFGPSIRLGARARRLPSQLSVLRSVVSRVRLARCALLTHAHGLDVGNELGACTGKNARNVLPIPTLLSTSILPPCASTMRLASVSPRPTPPVPRERLRSPRKNAVNALGKSSLEMPMPPSLTSKANALPA